MTDTQPRRGRAARAAKGALATCMLALMTAGSAHAATTASVSGSTLFVDAAPGKRNAITVTQLGAFTVTDVGDTVTAGAGCSTLAANSVRCSLPGASFVWITASDLNDTVTKATLVNGYIEGEDGNDVLAGGRGWNRIYGGPGNDTLTGGPNIDFLTGGTGADLLSGGGADDRVSYGDRTAPVSVTIDGVADDGEAGEADNVRPDVEYVGGGSGSDTLTGSAGPNYLYGGSGRDVLNGLGGADTLRGGRGPDTENGGDGDDSFEQPTLVGDRRDVFNGGAGSADRVSYADRTAALVVDVDGIADDGRPGELDNVQSDVEQVVGGIADDTLTGSGAADVLLGGDGNDTLSGLGGPDTLRGDAGDDTLLGGTGDDALTSVDGVLGNDALDGEGDSDSCSFDRFDAWANCEALAVFP